MIKEYTQNYGESSNLLLIFARHDAGPTQRSRAAYREAHEFTWGLVGLSEPPLGRTQQRVYVRSGSGHNLSGRIPP